MSVESITQDCIKELERTGQQFEQTLQDAVKRKRSDFSSWKAEKAKQLDQNFQQKLELLDRELSRIEKTAFSKPSIFQGFRRGIEITKRRFRYSDFSRLRDQIESSVSIDEKQFLDWLGKPNDEAGAYFNIYRASYTVPKIEDLQDLGSREDLRKKEDLETLKTKIKPVSDTANGEGSIQKDYSAHGSNTIQERFALRTIGNWLNEIETDKFTPKHTDTEKTQKSNETEIRFHTLDEWLKSRRHWAPHWFNRKAEEREILHDIQISAARLLWNAIPDSKEAVQGKLNAAIFNEKEFSQIASNVVKYFENEYIKNLEFIQTVAIRKREHAVSNIDNLKKKVSDQVSGIDAEFSKILQIEYEAQVRARNTDVEGADSTEAFQPVKAEKLLSDCKAKINIQLKVIKEDILGEYDRRITQVGALYSNMNPEFVPFDGRRSKIKNLLERSQNKFTELAENVSIYSTAKLIAASRAAFNNGVLEYWLRFENLPHSTKVKRVWDMLDQENNLGVSSFISAGLHTTLTDNIVLGSVSSSIGEDGRTYCQRSGWTWLVKSKNLGLQKRETGAGHPVRRIVHFLFKGNQNGY